MRDGARRDGEVRAGSRLVIVSNRGPVQHSFDTAGKLRKGSGTGGVAVAVGCAVEQMPVTWIAGAMSDGDREAAETQVDLGTGKLLHFVSPPADAYQLSYGTFCNALLWFVQHGIADQLQRDIAAEAPPAWSAGYLPVNQAFANATADELAWTGGDRVMLHDYHLYAAPRMIRARQPDAMLQHFIHIPWPDAEVWRALPDWIVSSICDGLLANDSVVFQTEASVGRFLETCRAHLSAAQVDQASRTVLYRRGRTRVWANAVSVQPEELLGRLTSPGAQAYREKLAPEPGDRTIVRVDRLDPAKNILGGFRAYDRLLRDHPEWRRRARFLAFLVPSRTTVPEYHAYAAKVFEEVRAINDRHGDAAWRPITVFHEHNRLQALVALTMYDVLLVNSIADGMNLVAKEGVAVNERDGALVLSTGAGAFEELRGGALPVQPHDIDQTALALHTALTLSPLERRARAQRMREAIEEHDLRDWLQLLLDDFSRIGASRRREAIVAGAV